MAAGTLHPAENRGYRELFAFSQQLVSRWSRLARRLSDREAREALEKGVEVAGLLLSELRERLSPYGLHGQFAARGSGARLADARTGVGDRFLERSQALRLAVLDAYRLAVLLDFLAEVAAGRGDEDLRAFCTSWERRLARVEKPVRRAAAATGADPDRAIEPLDPSPVGKAAHGVAFAIGSAGEWVDARAARKRRR